MSFSFFLLQTSGQIGDVSDQTWTGQGEVYVEVLLASTVQREWGKDKKDKTQIRLVRVHAPEFSRDGIIQERESGRVKEITPNKNLDPNQSHRNKSLSPCKRRKESNTDKENQLGANRVSAQGNGSTSPSNISIDVRMDASMTDPISNNVFSATSPSPAGNLPSGHFYMPYGSYFYQDTCPEVPVGAPAQSYHEFKLRPPQPTVKEVPDEDDRSYLATRHQNILTDNMESLDSSADPDALDLAAPFNEGASADPKEFSNVYDVYCTPGKLREASMVLHAAEATKDLAVLLHRESRGASGGYKDPKFDPWWCNSLLINEDLAANINLHLQEIGNHITTEKLVLYLSVSAGRQYSDGHERPDIVFERDKKYIPALKKLEARMQHWDRDGRPEFGPPPAGKWVIIWYQDESIFYVHNRKRKNWHH
ncbi:hypothetical protein DFH08DRAFT_812849 [Mycena albidolilacea]|uniref:Uncharacterized protein n=1 Tax=Mycena albidolilacea TaxID=1033008 RepID=A0AAD6ZSY4_9AGAR|nr:hypothetical protein DFH08DRAFT_812849 [Mycena albidolilacea]